MQDMAPHLEASLQRDADRIRGKLTEMSALGEKALRDCVKALAERNRQTAYAVIKASNVMVGVD